MSMTPSDYEKLSFKLGQIFKPATPINRADLFAGRRRQVQDVVDAINQESQHIILYGERGVGKTSLANVLSSKLVGVGSYKLMPHINCTAADSFSDIWRRVFAEAKDKIEDGEFDLPEEVVDALGSNSDPYVDVSPDAIRRVLNRVGKECLLVIIIDEFDTVESDEARQAMADTLKFLADKNVPATVILIGVADDVEDLIRQHQSTERCLIQVPMPRMSNAEIAAVITTGFRFLEMTIADEALKCIAYLSKGLPYYPHLLALQSGREALHNQSVHVSKVHVRSGIRISLEKVQASVQANYRDAVSSSRQDAQYKQVLLACALAHTDDFGFFAPVDVREPYSKVKKTPTKIEAFVRHLHAFSDIERGPVLERKIKGTRRPRFRFVSPLLQPYVLLRGVDEGLISEDDLKAATAPVGGDPMATGMLF